ncbi:MAG: helix-turn-helix transcriptional regulator [Clostridia bacterium]|nr:helix-turn-helix transcriptional regulator [Clostridia bacterium]
MLSGSIGKQIRDYRLKKNLRQEDLAEKVNVSPNYIGMIERDEKIPALDTFVDILNVLDASADIVLSSVLKNGYKTKNSVLDEKLSKLTETERNKIYDVIDTLLKNS